MNTERRGAHVRPAPWPRGMANKLGLYFVGLQTVVGIILALIYKPELFQTGSQRASRPRLFSPAELALQDGRRGKPIVSAAPPPCCAPQPPESRPFPTCSRALRSMSPSSVTCTT